ncbi:ubiquinol oxidase subunit II [Pseudoalteromonas sp. NZS127_1]|uniref:ubiquinol oxidase subunit II n=1 Tax=unclassified Pseudoalteromonas TaxID=194690 RepID=UPI0013FE106E|nr:MULTISPECIES: ubiquinol oxidase subunit II [unclassified Pseudoalteromonas]MBG9995492.1 ubiquinol oxidase subunit II [Pseudoalteromonas sp. NZS127_1]MBH0013738.1 ubiquinol oxidase subunit II [Pseudoalteromonas sp. NZS100_1]MBH0028103.1 ubiquinol oxidase subunit II [Pseudoalteromonas sp. SWN29]MBH0039998.1 ubiquinol oxidase subunit II [Pseudoalteromonas sp. SWN166]MBH0042752.1 ubiquinol oxidase subunit II [Pseudoalteromonas sp. SWXJZ10B]
MLIRNLCNIALASTVLALSGCKGGILDPKGQIGIDEKNLIIIATVLMLLVVVPVIVMTLYFAWKYRDTQTHEIYAPKWAHSNKIEAAVWAVPIVIVIILGVITWVSTQELDPYKPIEGKGKHLTVEVVSLNWKWLFIYPEQGIATVNELVFPANVPVEYKITSESTMNSFFIPQLGSQIYSMAGMETKLHLIANEPGTFKGFSANYSGAGFTGMKFNAIATPTQAGFDKWVSDVKANSSANNLTHANYVELAKASENNPVAYYGKVEDSLFHTIIMKYMQAHGDMNKKHNAMSEHGEMGMQHHAMDKHSAKPSHSQDEE